MWFHKFYSREALILYSYLRCNINDYYWILLKEYVNTLFVMRFRLVDVACVWRHRVSWRRRQAWRVCLRDFVCAGERDRGCASFLERNESLSYERINEQTVIATVFYTYMSNLLIVLSSCPKSLVGPLSEHNTCMLFLIVFFLTGSLKSRMRFIPNLTISQRSIYLYIRYNYIMNLFSWTENINFDVLIH